MEIGADPRSKLGLDVGTAVNDQGEVIVDKLMRTSVEGVFAAGDLSDASGNLKQTINCSSPRGIGSDFRLRFRKRESLSLPLPRHGLPAGGCPLVLGRP